MLRVGCPEGQPPQGRPWGHDVGIPAAVEDHTPSQGTWQIKFCRLNVMFEACFQNSTPESLHLHPGSRGKEGGSRCSGPAASPEVCASLSFDPGGTTTVCLLWQVPQVRGLLLRGRSLAALSTACMWLWRAWGKLDGPGLGPPLALYEWHSVMGKEKQSCQELSRKPWGMS